MKVSNYQIKKMHYPYRTCLLSWQWFTNSGWSLFSLLLNWWSVPSNPIKYIQYGMESVVSFWFWIRMKSKFSIIKVKSKHQNSPLLLLWLLLILTSWLCRGERWYHQHSQLHHLVRDVARSYLGDDMGVDDFESEKIMSGREWVKHSNFKIVIQCAYFEK